MSGLEQAAPKAAAEQENIRREKIAALAGAMATHFNVPVEDFWVIKDVRQAKPFYTVAYTALAGINRGSWDNIFSEENAESFMVEVDGEKHDTRAGMTQAAYETFIGACVQSRMRTLPDSEDLYSMVGFPSRAKGWQPYTWLTGETYNDRDRKAGLGCVRSNFNPFDDPHAYITYRHKNRNDEEFLFRPAVAVDS